MKLRSGLMVATAFALGIGFGVVAPAVRGALADSQPGSDTYQQLSLFGNIFERVRADYVKPEPASKLIYDALNGMLTGLDPHSGYMDKTQYSDMQAETSGHFGGLGLEVTEAKGLITVISPIDDTPASKAGIKSGDVIVAIDKKPVIGFSLNKAVNEMRGPVGSKITLTIKRRGISKPITAILTRATIHVKAVKSALYGTIGYIRLASFAQNANHDIREAVQHLKTESHGRITGYILDLRNNPGGLLDQGVDVANDFLNSGEIVSTHGRHNADDAVWYAHANGDITDGAPLVVMINSGTASAAEIVTAALQQNRRAVVLGARSFGKGSVQTIFTLPGRGALRLTTALYYTPSGQSIQDYGVQPDVVVHEAKKTKDQFPTLREDSMPNAFHNPSGLKAPPLPPKIPLPAVVNTIASRPPANWPQFKLDDPATDYQLQMALKLANAMAVKPKTASAQ